MSLPVTQKKFYTEADQDLPPQHRLNVAHFNEFVFGREIDTSITLSALPKDYVIEEFLGLGSYGSVYKAHKTADKTQAFAIKFYKSTHADKCSSDLSHQEKLHALAPHLVMPIHDQGNITIKTHEFTESSSYFVTDCFGKSLYITFACLRFPPVSFLNLLTTFQKALSLYKILDENELSLRDCKPPNILVDKQFDVRFIDISVGKYSEKEPSLQTATYFRSPYEHLGYRHKSETPFALGATLYFMVTKKFLFNPRTPQGTSSTQDEMLRYFHKVFSFIGMPSQKLMRELRDCGYRVEFQMDPKTNTCYLQPIDDKTINCEEAQKEVLSQIKQNLESGRFTNTPEDTDSLANEFLEMIQGLTNIEDPWSPDRALESNLMQRISAAVPKKNLAALPDSLQTMSA